MTLFWILAAAITAAVVAMLLRPLLRSSPPAPSRADWDLEVYRDQLSEIERDLARGVIAPAQADAARTEIGRRILGAAAAPVTTAATIAPPSKGAALALLVALPLASLALYLALGRPDLPDRPFAERAAESAAAAATPQSVLEAMARLAERLASQPNDLEGWVLLAQSYGKMGQLPDSIEAWRKAAALAPDDLDISGNLAETLISSNRGLVPEEARQLLDAIQAKLPDEPRAGHYLALARQQAGDDHGALERWIKLAAASPENAPWLPLVHERIAEVAGRLHLDAAAITPKPLPPKTAEAPADQAKAIRAMVEGLRAKLEANPADVAGWLRLLRAYEVLGESDRRLDAAKRLRAQAPHQPDVLVAYAEAVIAATPGTVERLPAEAAAAFREALAVAPETTAALWYLGLDTALAGQAAEARPLLERLLKQLDPASPDYQAVKTRLDSLK